MEEKITKLKPAPALANDGEFWVSTGRSRFEKKWKNKKVKWSYLVGKLSEPQRTPETYAEYLKMTKADQDKAKDIGGFVGGVLEGGKRGSGTVKERSILSFDLDNAPVGFWEDYSITAEYASACYTTHKHNAKKPRFRLLVPLSRSVSPDEYEAIARMLASDIGMDYMDASTFQPSRLMYWPSCSEDGDFFADHVDAPFLDADKVLARYPDWTDATEWPLHPDEAEHHRHEAKKQGDPTAKPGVIGAFCRAYDVPAAIEKFLGDVYLPTDKADRYTYAAGSTAAGLVIYDDGKFAFSNHGTDPAGGQLCNAFDLVRIHLFGDQDEDAAGDLPATKRPSYKAMVDFALEDDETKIVMAEERAGEVRSAWDDDEEGEGTGGEKEQGKSWKKKLKYTKKGLEKTVENCELIFANDPELEGIALNELTNQIEVAADHPVPWPRGDEAWTDADDAGLYTYVARAWTDFPRQVVQDQLILAARRRAFHPVRAFLDKLPEWDGEPRAETLLVDFLGAEDNVFTREATVKILTAAVARAYKPGTKFDNILVIEGPQGCGKSTLVSVLAGSWFSDDLSFNDMKDKTASEKIQGCWVVEISELAGMRKSEMETIKSFISRQVDKYRPAYGRNTECRPRQCVFFGTVNAIEGGYLRDITGNRRFWSIHCTGTGSRRPWTITREERDQIWAEMLFRYRDLGEDSLVLSEKAAKLAAQKQTEALETDDAEGIVEQYLNLLVPENWKKMTKTERSEFLEGMSEVEGTMLRTEITRLEVWNECKDIQKLCKSYRQDFCPMISRTFKRLGWSEISAKRDTIYGSQRAFKRPDKVTDE